MTKFSMTLTLSENAPAAVYERRDQLAKMKNAPVDHHELYDDEVISRLLSESTDGAAKNLIRVAGKAGFKEVVERGTGYGIHGAGEGPIEFWYQKVFSL